MANLAAVLDSSSSNGEKIKQIYSDLELTMEGSNGQLKSGYELLSDLSGKWSGLSSDTQKYIATTIAGTTQLNNFLALMNNFSHATAATNKALNSSGSAMRENERYMGGLEAQTTALKAEFQDFANNVITNEMISAVLKLAKALLSLSNNGFGQFITRFGLASAATLGFTTMVVQLGSKALPLLKAAFVSTGAAAGTAAVGATALQAALGWISLAIGAIVAVAPLIIDAWNDSHKSVEELSAELNNLNSELETNKARVEEIQSLSWNERTSEINREYYALLAENEELERNIKLRQMEIKDKAETGKIQVGVGYQISPVQIAATQSAVFSELSQQLDLGKITEAQYNSAVKSLNMWIDKMKDTIFDSYEDMYNAIRSYDFYALPFQPDLIEDYRSQLEDSSDSVAQYAKGVGEVLPEMNKYNDLLESQGKLTTAQNEDYIALMNSAGDYYTALKQLHDAGQPIGEDNEKFIKQYEQLSKKYDDASAASENFGLSMKQIKDTFPDLYKYFLDAGVSIESLGKYCKDTGKSAKDMARALYDAAIAAKQNEIVQFGISHAEGKMSAESGMGLSAAGREYLAGIKSMYKEIADLKEKRDSAISKLTGSTGTSASGKGDGKKDLTVAQKRLEKFNEALKLLDHQLAMDQISTEEYYASLQKLMDTYLQDADNQETLWKYQEKIYSWKKKAAEDEQSAQEKINSELQKQIELQEKLRDAAEALAKAQQKRILVFRKSGYGYMQDVGAISEAQAAYAKVKSGYAGGTVYSSAGLHMFGENGPELGVIGSGNGVLPSEITRNLWEWGAQRPEEMLASVPASGGDTISFSGVTMAFPNVRSGSDAQGFMESLVMLARQRAYKRY